MRLRSLFATGQLKARSLDSTVEGFRLSDGLAVQSCPRSSQLCTLQIKDAAATATVTTPFGALKVASPELQGLRLVKLRPLGNSGDEGDECGTVTPRTTSANASSNSSRRALWFISGVHRCNGDNGMGKVMGKVSEERRGGSGGRCLS